MNGETYDWVVFILQTAQAHNITIDGSGKYNVPSEKITLDTSAFESSQNLTSYATAAISGADDFNDDNTTIKDMFDMVVNNTRETVPTCEFSLFTHTCPFRLPGPNQVGTIWSLGYVQGEAFSEYILTITSSVTICMDGQSVVLSGSPHSVLSSSRIQFSSWEPLYVHPTPELENWIIAYPDYHNSRLTLSRRS